MCFRRFIFLLPLFGLLLSGLLGCNGDSSSTPRASEPTEPLILGLCLLGEPEPWEAEVLAETLAVLSNASAMVIQVIASGVESNDTLTASTKLDAVLLLSAASGGDASASVLDWATAQTIPVCVLGGELTTQQFSQVAAHLTFVKAPPGPGVETTIQALSQRAALLEIGPLGPLQTGPLFESESLQLLGRQSGEDVKSSRETTEALWTMFSAEADLVLAHGLEQATGASEALAYETPDTTAPVICLDQGGEAVVAFERGAFLGISVPAPECAELLIATIAALRDGEAVAVQQRLPWGLRIRP